MHSGMASGGNGSRPEQDPHHDEDSSSHDEGPRYPHGFFARYLREFVFDKMDIEGWRQYQVAEWVGIPDDTLSVYLNRHAHPTGERRELLARLGCDEREMIEAELADKLDLWMRAHDVGGDDVLRFLERIRERDASVARRRATQRARSREADARSNETKIRSEQP